MENHSHTSDGASWTELITSSSQICIGTLQRHLISSISDLRSRVSTVPFLRSPSEQIGALNNALSSIYALYTRYTPKMASVDLGGQYKRIMRFFWDTEPENDDPQAAPIWCLGQMYLSDGLAQSSPDARDMVTEPTTSQDDESDRDAVLISRQSAVSRMTHSMSDSDHRFSPMARMGADEKGWPESFLQDFESRFWFTYRSSFPAIKRSEDPKASSSLSIGVRLRSQLVDQNGFTADTGWGCMIRSGQCVLANALAIRNLGRDWRRGAKCEEERRLISLFADDPRAPYSLHRFVQHGEAACGKYPGEWFGPSATARCIEALSATHDAPAIKVYVTGDGADVYEDTFLKLASTDNGEFKPVLLLIGTRLGIDRVNPVYWEALRQVFQLPQSLGIAGGRPSASHYFVGVQGDQFFYLDPHQTRPALPYHEDLTEYTQDDIESCHTRRLRRLHMDAMDPSMLIAFLIQSRADWFQWKESILQIRGKPVLYIADHEPPPGGTGIERAEAIDEVETFDEDEMLPNDESSNP